MTIRRAVSDIWTIVLLVAGGIALIVEACVAVLS